MQRVLSFQMARGLNESSEFVTKRLCFSFLFSVGFFCLLGGFLLGRFAIQRSIEYRAEMNRLEIAGNGLDKTEYLQDMLLQQLKEYLLLDDTYKKYSEMQHPEQDDLLHVKHILSNYSFFHKVVQNSSYIMATAEGSQEPDRYVVLSANSNGIGIALEMAKVLNHIHKKYDWKSRRTLIFCITFDINDSCPELLPTFIQYKIIAYITLYGNFLQGGDYVAVSGSNIIQSIAIDSIRTSEQLKSYISYDEEKLAYHEGLPPRLHLDIPHAVFSFVNNKNTSRSEIQDENIRHRSIIVAQIISRVLWRLSESLVLTWNTKYLNDGINNVLNDITISDSWQVKERIKESLTEIISRIKLLYEALDKVANTKYLSIRMLNDFLLDLDKALLCPDNNFHSRTDLAYFSTSHDSSEIITYLNNMLNCYNNVVEILENWA